MSGKVGCQKDFHLRRGLHTEEKGKNNAVRSNWQGEAAQIPRCARLLLLDAMPAAASAVCAERKVPSLSVTAPGSRSLAGNIASRDGKICCPPALAAAFRLLHPAWMAALPCCASCPASGHRGTARGSTCANPLRGKPPEHKVDPKSFSRAQGRPQHARAAASRCRGKLPHAVERRRRGAGHAWLTLHLFPHGVDGDGDCSVTGAATLDGID